MKKKTRKPRKTETVPIEDKSIIDATLETASTNSKASTVTILTAILEKTNSLMNEWPHDVYNKVLARIAQMPRTGWKRLHSVFCSKFKVQIDLEENEKTRKYDLIANEFALTYKCREKFFHM